MCCATGEAYAGNCAPPASPVTAVRYQGITHGCLMLNALRDTRAATTATAQAIATLRCLVVEEHPYLSTLYPGVNAMHIREQLRAHETSVGRDDHRDADSEKKLRMLAAAAVLVSAAVHL
jgi:hypothetical protein